MQNAVLGYLITKDEWRSVYR